MLNKQWQLHNLKETPICRINHCINDFIKDTNMSNNHCINEFINQNHINNSKMQSEWWFGTYEIKVCLRPRSGNQVQVGS